MSNNTADLPAVLQQFLEHALKGQVVELPNQVTGVLVPDGFSLAQFEPAYVEKPFITARPSFTRVESFTRYVNDYKTAHTRLFSNSERGSVMAVIDYHEAGKGDAAHKSSPLGHIVTLNLAHSPEWRAWTGQNGRPMAQKPFAEFLEENQVDIQVPDSATVLESVKNLKQNTNVDFQSKVDLQSGRMNFRFVETEGERVAGQLSVPAKLTLALAVYDGEPRDSIEAYLRYKLETEHHRNGSEVKTVYFTIKLDGLERVKRKAFEHLLARVGAETGILPFEGTYSDGRY